MARLVKPILRPLDRYPRSDTSTYASWITSEASAAYRLAPIHAKVARARPHGIYGTYGTYGRYGVQASPSHGRRGSPN
jgi:hypothetical protein